jgi:thioredoxin reductase (NADPH)
MAEVAVIGAGPAGIAAAIQLSRSGHDVIVYEKVRVGGALWNAGWVGNYPGFPGGITGKRLAGMMERQLFEYVESVVRCDVRKVEKQGSGFIVEGDDFEGVILCTGTEPKKAGFPGEDELASAGLLRYGIAEMEDGDTVKEACVIGGGEASMDMAVSLCRAGTKVTLLHRSDPTGIDSLLETATAEEGIAWIRDGVIKARTNGEKAVIELRNRELTFDLVLLAVGRKTVTPKLVGFTAETPPAGFLVAGDAARGRLGQTAMAVGDGVEMAMELDSYLETTG